MRCSFSKMAYEFSNANGSKGRQRERERERERQSRKTLGETEREFQKKQRKENDSECVQSMHENENFNCSFREILMQKQSCDLNYKKCTHYCT